MNTLKDISCDIIRQNWLNYNNKIFSKTYALQRFIKIDNNIYLYSI